MSKLSVDDSNKFKKLYQEYQKLVKQSSLRKQNSLIKDKAITFEDENISTERNLL